jgi:hypothetical protein
MKAIETIMALVTWDMVGNENPVTHLKPFHPLSHRNNFSCDLMAEDSGGFLDSVPFHDITAADAAGHHFHQ